MEKTRHRNRNLEEASVVQDSSGNGMSGENLISCSANAIASVR